MVAFYKHDIPGWMNGTENLSDGAYRAYHVVCELIYLHEGPIARNEHGIAGRCRQSLRAFRKNLDQLIAMGKLQIVDGQISESYAISELEKIRSNRENAGKGGGISRKRGESSGKGRENPGKSVENLGRGGENPGGGAENPGGSVENPGEDGEIPGETPSPTANPLKNNDTIQATLQQRVSLKEKIREEKTREEKIKNAAAAACVGKEDAHTALDRSCREALPPDVTWKVCGDPDLSPIIRTVSAGADIDRHVLPTIRDLSQRQLAAGQTVRSWKFFADAIGERAQTEATTRSIALPNPQAVDWVATVERFRQRGLWTARGPEPGYAGCRAPPEVLRQFGYEVGSADEAGRRRGLVNGGPSS